VRSVDFEPVIPTVVSHYPKVGDKPGQQRLRQAIARFDRGEIDRNGLEEVANDVTSEVIEEQEQAGIRLVTDGQIRWQDPLTYITSRLSGFETTGLLRWFETNTYYRQPLATGPIAWTQPILVDDYRFAKAHAKTAVKPVLTGPYTIATLSHTKHHDSHRAFVLDLARALNAELKALAREQPEWIQVDEPAIVNNPSVRYPRDFDLFHDAMNVLTDGVDARLALYCYHGDVADVPRFASLPFQLFGLDMVQGAANWGLLDGWARVKGLGLGVVDARNVRLEKEEELGEAIARGVRAAGAENLHVSPSCGLEFLPRDEAKTKLELLARVARAQEVKV
jgi:5-methyltetrahydropteroyltriglutamate--homocysteine methyltransferase